MLVHHHDMTTEHSTLSMLPLTTHAPCTARQSGHCLCLPRYLTQTLALALSLALTLTLAQALTLALSLVLALSLAVAVAVTLILALVVC